MVFSTNCSVYSSTPIHDIKSSIPDYLRTTNMSLSLGLSIPLRRIPASKPRHSVIQSLKSPQSCARGFSTTLKRDASWGFIGLGQMGKFPPVVLGS